MLKISTQDSLASDKEAKKEVTIKRWYILLFISETF